MRIRDFWKGLRLRSKILLGGLVFIPVAIVAGLLLYGATRPYAVLFQDLNAEDVSKIVSFFDANGITDYRVQDNSRILVPESQEANLRMRVVMDGYAATGTNYELYLSNVSALSSDTDRRQLQIYDLQNRLGATIRSFTGVRDARVYLNIGEDRRYILSSDDLLQATAAVSVTMQNNQTLTNQQAAAIRDLVSHAMLGLVIDNVSITDQAGNTYSGDNTADAAETAQTKMNLERRYNEYFKGLILDVLAPMFGAENVTVSVNSTVDISRRYQDSVLYDEPDWAARAGTGEGIIGSRAWGNAISRGDGEGAGGTVGTGANADLNEYVINAAQLTGTEQEIATSGEVNYNVSTTQTQTDTPPGVLMDVMVSVGIWRW